MVKGIAVSLSFVLFSSQVHQCGLRCDRQMDVLKKIAVNSGDVQMCGWVVHLRHELILECGHVLSMHVCWWQGLELDL